MYAQTESFGVEFVVGGMLQNLAQESADVLEHVAMTDWNRRQHLYTVITYLHLPGQPGTSVCYGNTTLLPEFYTG